MVGILGWLKKKSKSNIKGENLIEYRSKRRSLTEMHTSVEKNWNEVSELTKSSLDYHKYRRFTSGSTYVKIQRDPISLKGTQKNYNYKEQ